MQPYSLREISEKLFNAQSQTQRGNESMMNRNGIGAVEAAHAYKEIEAKKEYLRQQREYFEKQEKEVEAELERLTELVPALRRKKTAERAEKLLAELQKNGKLAFKTSANITVCVDLNYSDTSEIDREDIGIREYNSSRYGIPKNQVIERVIAAHEALSINVPDEFIQYYSIR